MTRSQLDLHSTMLLLILWAILYRSQPLNIYIPLCFYLYAAFNKISIFPNEFTFHYASTYTEPICFAPSSSPHLHSTMLLLIRILNFFRFPLDYIYIPLCFYLYICSCKLSISPVTIYIPLCFYLYDVVSVAITGPDIFTFHYASTYTLDWIDHNNPDFRIYIPLCFYLYGPWLRSSQTVLSFTFHYASTYTILQTGIEIIGKYLHSTMLLLILRRQNSIKSFKIIYIPLCFYLYLPVRTWEMHILLYLHSTMLLLIPIPDILHLPTNNIFTFHYASTYTDLT